MKKRFLALLLIPLLICGCKTEKKDEYQYQQQNIQNPRKVGEIGEFNLLTPDNDFSTNTGFTFTWEEANNADYYQLEIANTVDFENDPDEVYVRENNLYLPKFDLSYSLPKKDIFYYWRVTAKNKDHTKECNASGRFFYESVKVDNIPIEIEDEQDWVLHKEGSYADISIDRNDFFGNGKNSLVITFDKEHTSQGIPKSDGWIVVTKTEDRELYGTDSFYFNFYYSGHDSTVLVRVLDYDGEYWHNQVQISNNAKQTIVMKYEDFSKDDMFLETMRKKCEQRLFTTKEMTWQQISDRAATQTVWGWYYPSQMDSLKADCLKKDKWRESSGYIIKGPFEKEPTSVSVEQIAYNEETEEFTLKVRGIGGRVYYDIGSEPTSASNEITDSTFTTKEPEVYFACIDNTGERKQGVRPADGTVSSLGGKKEYIILTNKLQ